MTFSTGTGGTIAGKQQTQRPLLTTTVLKINNPFLAEQKIPGVYLFQLQLKLLTMATLGKEADRREGGC